MERSIYESIYPEDSRQYRALAKRYMDLKPENYAEAFEVMKLAWAYAQRWSDIASNVEIIATEKGIKKTDLKEWAYQRYRQMQLIHESSRMLWGMGEREAKELNLIDRKRG